MFCALFLLVSASLAFFNHVDKQNEKREQQKRDYFNSLRKRYDKASAIEKKQYQKEKWFSDMLAYEEKTIKRRQSSRRYPSMPYDDDYDITLHQQMQNRLREQTLIEQQRYIDQHLYEQDRFMQQHMQDVAQHQSSFNDFNSGLF